MITFAVVLPIPPINSADWAEIASGELTVTLPAVEPIVIATAKTDQEANLRLVSDARFVGAQGVFVGLSFLYVDDAGNRGAAVTANVELLDTVPPVAPEAIGLVATGEV